MSGYCSCFRIFQNWKRDFKTCLALELCAASLKTSRYLYINLYIWLTISSCYGSIPLALGLIGRDGGLSALCHSCGFACQQRVLKTFLGPNYLCSNDVVVWLWHLLVNLYIWLTVSSCYDSIPLAVGLVERYGPGYLCSNDGIVWLWYLLTNFCIYIYIYIDIYIYKYIWYSSLKDSLK